MPTDIFQEYYLAIEPIEASRLLSYLAVADYPHLKREGRTKIHRALSRKSRPRFTDARVVKSGEYFKTVLGLK